MAIGALAALAAITGCGGDTSSSEAKTPRCEPAYQSGTEPPEFFNPPKGVVDKGEKLVAVVKTNCGAFRIALDTTRAPETVNSFAKLARLGFYENRSFERIVPGRLIGGGDPPGAKSIGAGYSIDERPPPDLDYTRGVVAMAKAPGDPPGRSRSEFFVVVAPDAELPPEYALIGEVDKGLDVVELIGKFGKPSGEATKKIVIEWIWAKRPSPEEEESPDAVVPPELL